MIIILLAASVSIYWKVYLLAFFDEINDMDYCTSSFLSPSYGHCARLQSIPLFYYGN